MVLPGSRWQRAMGLAAWPVVAAAGCFGLLTVTAAGISRAYARCVSLPNGRGDHDAAAVGPPPPQQPLLLRRDVRPGQAHYRRGPLAVPHRGNGPDDRYCRGVGTG